MMKYTKKTRFLIKKETKKEEIEYYIFADWYFHNVVCE